MIENLTRQLRDAQIAMPKALDRSATLCFDEHQQCMTARHTGIISSAWQQDILASSVEIQMVLD
jgi:hypothetical protein